MSKSWHERPKKRSEQSGRVDDFENMLQNLSPELQWLKVELARLKIAPNDPMGPLLKVILQCSDNMGTLPKLSDEVKDNLRDFKASVYDVRRETDKVAHLLQRKLGGIHQMPISRAMWACALTGFFGALLGITAMGGLVLFAVKHDCNLETLQCPKLHIPSTP
ncbi:MAG: hypothetical protein WBA57_18505 [Elainellaceae cyanobacterium]